jgi:hypothetical protein
MTVLKEQQHMFFNCCCSSNLETIFSQKKKLKKCVLIEVVILGEFFGMNNYFQLDFTKRKLPAHRLGAKRRRRLKNVRFFFYR